MDSLDVDENLLSNESDQTDSENIDDDVEDAEQTEEEIAEESEEIDIDGHKVSLPKSKAEKLKAERLMQADYTRKTQEVAEQRKHLEFEREQFQRQIQIQNEFVKEFGQLESLNAQLQQYEQINWNQLSTDDPAESNRLFIQMQQLKEARNILHGNLTQKQQQRQFEEQQAIAKRIEDGRRMLEREIKDWSPDLQVKLVQFARDEGWSDAEIERITPVQVKNLHKLYVGAQVLQKQSAKPNVTPIKPVTKVGSTSSVKKDPTKMTDDEYNDWRRSSIQRFSKR